MPMNELSKMTACQVVDLLKHKQISPTELIEIAEERMDNAEPLINAVPTRCIDRAIHMAKKIKNNLPSNLPPHYLYGLPLLVKDLTEVTEVEGVRTTYGSQIFAHNIPDYSNYLVKTLERNGAVVIGKTNTPEFGAGGNTFNDVFGATLNPWNTTMTCGGSSGGSAAALAAGEAWLATGNDLAGSVRIPASFCSVVGFRPSPGRIASGPSPVLFDGLGVEGPMGRNVADVALMLDAQIGFYPGDPLSLPKPELSFSNAVENKIPPKKIGFSPDLGFVPVDREVRQVCTRAVESWQAHGVTVTADCPDFCHAEFIFQTLRAELLASRIGSLIEKHHEVLKPELVWNIEKGFGLTVSEIAKAQLLRAELYYSAIRFFESHDLLVTPTVMAPPFDVNIRYLENVEDTALETYISWLALTFAITITACPCISIPCGFTASGLPVGIQIIGPPRADAKVLSAASFFEEIIGLHQLVPIEPICPESA